MTTKTWLKILNWVTLICLPASLLLVGLAMALAVAAFGQGYSPIRKGSIIAFVLSLFVFYAFDKAMSCRSQLLGQRPELWEIRKSLWRG